MAKKHTVTEWQEVAELRAPDKNIIFVGEGEPTTAIHGVFKAELPDAETQKAGFYHEKAKEIIGHFPKKYKRFKKLGE